MMEYIITTFVYNTAVATEYFQCPLEAYNRLEELTSSRHCVDTNHDNGAVVLNDSPVSFDFYTQDRFADIAF
jgi:hypothetical protein